MHRSTGDAVLWPLLLCLFATAMPLGCTPSADTPNIVFVTLHATRRDNVSTYGYKRETTPNLSELAKDAELYAHAYTVSNRSLPAHASLFTGTYPRTHGALHHPDGTRSLADSLVGPQFYAEERVEPLSDELPTLAEELGKAGYRRTGIVGFPWLKKAYGLARGFDEWDDQGIVPVTGRIASEVSDSAIEFLERDHDAPFFLFLGYGDSEIPYRPPEGLRRHFMPQVAIGRQLDHEARVARLNYHYDGELYYVDREFGRVLEALRDQGQYEDSLIVVTADHGEMLGEHRKLVHGNTLYEPEVRVPLLIKWPRSVGRAGNHNELVSTCGLMATLLDHVGVARPGGIECGTLGGGDMPIYAESNARSRFPGHDWQIWVERGGSKRLKLHRHSRGKRVRLFDLTRDPGETSEILDDAVTRDRMLETLEAFSAKLPLAASERALLEAQADDETHSDSAGAP